jgi:adenosylcobinamide-phosphate synthase
LPYSEPIFWFVLLGLPGAAVYRFANPANAMWAYRGARDGVSWESAGDIVLAQKYA